MKYFSISELTRSTTATQRGIDNAPSPEIEAKLTRLINQLLDPIREAWGSPITVNSGYRSPALNRAVGGVASSQHVKAEAADITVGSKAENRELFELILSMGIEFDQLIDERDYTWLHISLKEFGNRKQVLKL